MKIGFIGLGRMGSKMTANLIEAGVDLQVFAMPPLLAFTGIENTLLAHQAIKLTLTRLVGAAPRLHDVGRGCPPHGDPQHIISTCCSVVLDFYLYAIWLKWRLLVFALQSHSKQHMDISASITADTFCKLPGTGMDYLSSKQPG